MYDRCIVEINRRFPEHFPLEEFTFSNFKFAWNTIQARAFGRRLPWTALVPFADCLNHSNVQTKYDYLVNQNGKFRLFPTGENHYKKGEEVFNSYGRRHNENLLLDYGFAIMDNEWDEVDFQLMMAVMCIRYFFLSG
jgi:histone-lysine N-methyltransferase SETD3